MATNHELLGLYESAKALILGGAYVIPYMDERYMSPEDKALHGIYIKMLCIGPDESLVRMTRVAMSIAARLCSKQGEMEAVTDSLHLLRENDPEFYAALLDKLNKRMPKLTNANKHYSGGLLGLKTVWFYKETVDSLLIPEEGSDLPFLLDALYCIFWKEADQKKPDHAYVCQKIYAALPSEWQKWIAGEYERRKGIEQVVLAGLRARNFKLAYQQIEQASARYPEMGKLLGSFQKTLFSMKCTLILDPSLAQSDRYAPRLIHTALNSCPTAVAAIENL